MSVDCQKVIRIILDNLITHRCKDTTEFLDSMKIKTGVNKDSPRFELVFIPTHSSWLNQEIVEGVLSSISTVSLLLEK